MKKIAILLLLAIPLMAQTSKNGRVMTGTLATRPASCSPADQYNTTDGNGAYLCNPTSDTWQPIGGTGGPAFNQTIQVASVPMTQRPILNFPAYITCVDNAGNTSTDCTPNIMVGAGASHAAGLAPDPGAVLNNVPLCDNGTFSSACQGAPGTLSDPVTTPSSIRWGISGSPVDMRFGGPNPYLDAFNYGVRPANPNIAPQVPGITATINSGSATASLSSASTFQNGDGVVIYGAGATNAMSTPGAPTVTPSLAASETGSLLDVAAPAGGTQYCYQIVARDRMGGLTAASTETCTATGATTLGLNTVNISAISLSGNTVTVTTSSPHSLAAGATVHINGVVASIPAGGTVNSNTNPFNGDFLIIAAPSDNTHFTYSTMGDTRAGAPATGSSGTVAYWLDNRITWAGVTGAFQYYIYGRVTGGTKTLIGASWPDNVSLVGEQTYHAFDDFGATVTSLPVKPSYVPTSPPVAATNDMLATTISSGAGSTTLTLAATAGNTATNQTILFDDAITFLAAATQANAFATAVMLGSTGTTGGSFVFNSPITIPGGAAILSKGHVYLNETINLSNTSWVGETEKGIGNPSFAYTTSPAITINKANPGIYAGGGSALLANLFNLSIDNLGTNGVTMIMMDSDQSIPSSTFEDLNFSLATNTEYSNMAFVTRSIRSGGGAVWNFRNCTFITSQNSNLIGQYPFLYFNNGGNVKFDNVFFSGKGVLMRPPFPGGYLQSDNAYTQGGYMVMFGFTNGAGSGLPGTYASIRNTTVDTSLFPVVENLGGLILNVASTQGGAVIGNPPTAVSSFGAIATSVNDGIFGRTPTGNFPLANFNGSADLPRGYSLFTSPTIPPAPTCVIAAGGAVPVSTLFYYYVPIFANGSEGKFSLVCSATTTSGNQIVNLAWAKVPGATGYNLYRGPTASNVIQITCFEPSTTTNSFSDTAGACSQSAPAYESGGPAGIQNETVWANTFALAPTTAPTGVVNQTKFYMDSTLAWPSFKANNNTAYQVLGVTGSITAGHVGCFSGAVTGAMTDCPGGGGGSTNAALLGSVPWYSAAGTTSTLSGIAGPTTPNVFTFFGSTPSGGVAGVPSFQLPGIGGRTTSSASFSILDTDRATIVVGSNAGATAVALPGAGTTGFANNYVFIYKGTGAGHVATITPGAGTINASGTLVVNQGEECRIWSADNSNYLAICHDPIALAGTNIALTRGDNGLTFASSAGGGTVTHTGGALTTNALTYATGAADIASTGLGTTTTVLHGNAAGPPTYGAVALATDVSGTMLAAQVPAFTGDMTNSAGSLATTVAKINGTAFAGTNGNVVSFGAANIPADSGKVAANMVTQASNAGATNQIHASGGADKTVVAKSLADLSATDYVAGAGSVNVMTATLAPASTANTTGMTVKVLPNLANTTTTPTLNVNAVAAATITKCGTTALAVGDYTTTAIAYFTFDGTRWQLLNPQAVPCSGGGTATSTIASGTSTMGTSAVGSGACATTVTTAATGTLTTDTIVYTPNTNPQLTAGYAASATGSVYIWAYPTADNVNFEVCNSTGSSISLGVTGLTLNWKVVR